MSIIMLKNKIIGFPAVAAPQAIGDGEPAYGGRIIVEPSDPDAKALDAAMLEVAKGKWKEDGEAVLAMLVEEKRVCFSKLPYRSKQGKVYDGFEGKYHLGARNAKTQPSVFDQHGEPYVVEGKLVANKTKSDVERLIYSGCAVNAKVEIWAQDNSFGRRINCSLLGVMFAGDGERFGGGSAPASADDFTGLATEKADPASVL